MEIPRLQRQWATGVSPSLVSFHGRRSFCEEVNFKLNGKQIGRGPKTSPRVSDLLGILTGLGMLSTCGYDLL